MKTTKQTLQELLDEVGRETRKSKSQIKMPPRILEMFEFAVRNRNVAKVMWIWQNTLTDTKNEALDTITTIIKRKMDEI